MSRKPLTPTRKKQLEAYIRCLTRAERRIWQAHEAVTGTTGCLFESRGKPRTQNHLQIAMRLQGFEPFTLALSRLLAKRSKCQAELDGKTWQA